MEKECVPYSWVNLELVLPEDSGTYLTYVDSFFNYWISLMQYNHVENRFYDEEFEYQPCVTHWMFVPEWNDPRWIEAARERPTDWDDFLVDYLDGDTRKLAIMTVSRDKNKFMNVPGEIESDVLRWMPLPKIPE